MTKNSLSDSAALLALLSETSDSNLDLSRFCAAPSARLSHLSLEGDRAFPA